MNSPEMYATCVFSSPSKVKKRTVLRRLSSQNNVQIFRNGHLVSRASDYIIYSVEAASIGKVVAQYGPCA